MVNKSFYGKLINHLINFNNDNTPAFKNMLAELIDKYDQEANCPGLVRLLNEKLYDPETGEYDDVFELSARQIGDILRMTDHNYYNKDILGSLFLSTIKWGKPFGAGTSIATTKAKNRDWQSMVNICINEDKLELAKKFIDYGIKSKESFTYDPSLEKLDELINEANQKESSGDIRTAIADILSKVDSWDSLLDAIKSLFTKEFIKEEPAMTWIKLVEENKEATVTLKTPTSISEQIFNEITKNL